MLSFMFCAIGFLLQILTGTRANFKPTQISYKFFTPHEKHRGKPLLLPKKILKAFINQFLIGLNKLHELFTKTLHLYYIYLFLRLNLGSDPILF